ncbi:hypothetical protein, partial [Corallococcus praedator]|uniref:hypothetical protein n=1 Tax=Corallococcus praedator TaxID=2316724 RepID=UPI0013156E81
VEWSTAELGLGSAYELIPDFDAAAVAYRAVLTSATPHDNAGLTARIGLARVLTFSDPVAARGFADAAIAVVDAMQVSAPLRGQYAQLLALRGRIDLNDGKAAAARVWFDKALTHGRSLDNSKVSLADVRIRGDLALAAFRTGDLET